MKKYLLIALFAMMPCFALAQGTTVSQSIVITNSLGRPLGGVNVEVCTTVSAQSPACAGAASIFSDSALTVPIACSSSTCLTTDAIGQVPIFFASPGTYCYTVSGAYITDTSCHLIILFAATGGTGVITNPSGTQNVAQPGGTFLNVNRFEGIRFADQFANIQAAITDAAVIGAVIIPPTYAAADTFSNPNNILIWNQRKSTYANLLKFSTFGLAINSGNTCHSFGDSITVGQGATVPSTGGYVALLDSSFGYVVDNQGTAGSQAQDAGQIDKIYTTAVSQTSCTTWLPSFNDMRANGTGGQPLLTAKNTIFAGVVHAAIPDAYRVAGTAAGCTKTGTWTTNAGIYNNLSVVSTTNGDTVSCANIRGSTIYVVSIAATGGGGQLTVSVDGTQYGGTYNLFGYATSVAGRTYSPFIIRIPNLNSGPHTVLVTVVSATNAANSVNVVEVAGNGGRDYAGPNVYLGEVLHMTASGYALGAPFNNGSDAAVDAYSDAMRDICRQLSEDGLGVACIDTSRYNPTLDVSGDNIHPSDQGHQHITDAFISSINGTMEPRDKAFAGIVRKSADQIYSPLPNNYGLLRACMDASNCQIASNRDPNSGNNLNPASSGAYFNFGSDGKGKAGYTSTGAASTPTQVFQWDSNGLTATGLISTGTVIEQTTNGAQWIDGQISESITLSTLGTTTDSVANLLPANSILLGVTARVTTTITVATDWKLGDASTAGRFTAAIATLTSGTTTVGSVHLTTGIASATTGMFQAAAAKLRITTTGTPGAGVIRVTVFYRQMVPPTS